MGAGPLPKDQHQRERDTKRRQADAITLTDDGEIRGPALRGTFSENTVEWYETWRRSPQAQLFLATDWERLQLLAPLVDMHFRRPAAAYLTEIRMTEERLGALVVDRIRAKIRVSQDERELAPVTQLHAVAREGVAARLRAATPPPESEPVDDEEPGF